MTVVGKQRRAKNAIPRPKNSFMVYRQEKQAEIIQHHGRINNTTISEIAGFMWRAEDEEVKKAYREKAEHGKREHRRLYPDYKYSPKKPLRPRQPKKKPPLDAAKLDLHPNHTTASFDLLVTYMDQHLPEIRGTSLQPIASQACGFDDPTASVDAFAQTMALAQTHASQLMMPFMPLSEGQLLQLAQEMVHQQVLDPHMYAGEAFGLPYPIMPQGEGMLTDISPFYFPETSFGASMQ